MPFPHRLPYSPPNYQSTTVSLPMVLFLGTVILAIITQLAAAQPTADRPTNIARDYSSWASFCNDAACTDGCGEWVDITNPGCLGERGRGSIKFKSDDGPEVLGSLVYSPGDSCNCQTECDPFYFRSGEGCMALNGSVSFETFSYRLLGQHDGPCPDKGSNC